MAARPPSPLVATRPLTRPLPSPSPRPARATHPTPPPPRPQVGEIAADGYVVPLSAEGGTLGFAFVSYRSREVAQSAVLSLDLLRFDAKHTFCVVRLDEFLELQAQAAAGLPPTQTALVTRANHDDDYYWLHDEQSRDEFLLRFSLTDATMAPKGKAAEPEKHETEVLWADVRGAPLLDYGGESQKAARKVGSGYQQGVWADAYVAWSPRGTYLTTMHYQGAKLWHGKGFRSEGWQEGSASLRLEHAEVNAVLWSPNERYVCTWNGRARNEHPERAFVVWDIHTGLEVKAFRQTDTTEDSHGFVWSPDSAFLARIVSEVGLDGRSGVQELIQVYAVPTFRLLEDRSIPAPGARDLAWAPRRHNLLSWWTREHENIPITVSVMRLPGKEFVKQRPLINVEHARVAWHASGELCAVYAEKLTKVALAKKRAEAELQRGGAAARAAADKAAAAAAAASAAAAAAAGEGEEGGAKRPPGAYAEVICAGFQLEVFRFKSKDAPSDTLEVKDRVLEFAWEPTNARFALVLESKTFEKYEEPAENPRHLPRVRTRTITAWRIAFYALAERPGEIQLQHTYEIKRDVMPVPTGLHWSPKGDILILSHLAGRGGSGWMAFYDANLKRELTPTGGVSHDGANAIEWDPSGRMVASIKTRPLHGLMESRDSVGNGYQLWTFQGNRVHDAAKPKLFQLLWRPRWEGLLSEEEQRAVAKDLRRHISRYQDEDKSKLHRRSLLAKLRKLKARTEHRAFMSERLTDHEERYTEREERGLLAAGEVGAESDVLVELTREVLLSESGASVTFAKVE